MNFDSWLQTRFFHVQGPKLRADKVFLACVLVGTRFSGRLLAGELSRLSEFQQDSLLRAHGPAHGFYGSKKAFAAAG